MITFLEIEAVARMRVGETAPGFWSSADVLLVANQAQKLVAKDVSTRDHPWSILQETAVPVVSGTDKYILECDFMRIEAVSHQKLGCEPVQLTKANIKSMRLNNYQNFGDTNYRFYQVAGNVGGVVATGVATGGSAVTLQDTNLTKDWANVRVGDRVVNESDGNAHAEIISINNTASMIGLKAWIGGNEQAFKYGDTYLIQHKERTLKTLWVYPIVTFDNPIVYQGGIDSISVAQDSGVVSMEINIPAANIPADIPPDADALVQLQARSGANWAELHNFGIDDLKSGENIVLGTSFLIDRETEYRIVINYGPDATAVSTTGATVTMFGQTSDYLKVDYVPYPAPMVDGCSYCELDDFLHESMFRKMKQLMIEKKESLSPILVQLQNEYEVEIQKAKRDMRNFDESGIDHVVNSNSMDVNYANNGYTTNFGSIHDLFS